MAYQLPAEHEDRASRIPPETRAKLTDAELLARCLHAKSLMDLADGMSGDPQTSSAHRVLADRVLSADAPGDVVEKAAGLRALGDACQDLTMRRGYYQRAAELDDQPRPPAELVKSAQATVCAAGPPTRFTNRTGDHDMLTKSANAWPSGGWGW